MKNGFKLAYITLPILAIGVGVLAFVVVTSEPPERNPLAERATAVRAITAHERSVTPKVISFGLVSPARTYEAISQVAGTADFVNPAMQKGAILPEGADLLRLSPTDFNLAIAQARANIRAAEAQLAELAVSEENQTAALAIENQALALKAKDLKRAERLFAGGTVSQSTLDSARAAHLAQRQKLLSVESSLALLPTQRAVKIEQISVYQTSLDTATLNLERTELSLPIDGRVASVTVEVGQFVRAGQTVAVFDGIQIAEVEAQVSVVDLRRLLMSTRPDTDILATNPSQMTEVLRSLGLSARVNLRLGQEVVSWDASVDRISDTIDQKSGMLGVFVQVDTAYSGAAPGQRPPLTKGMFVEVEFGGAPVKGLVVPRSAIRQGRLLLADAEGRLRLLPVTPFLVQDDIALITETLVAGSHVIVSSPSVVVDGMLLDVTQDTGLMTRLAGEGSSE